MAMRKKKDRSDVLCFSHKDPVRATVRAHYDECLYLAEAATDQPDEPPADQVGPK
jgi:hypothetical protein